MTRVAASYNFRMGLSAFGRCRSKTRLNSSLKQLRIGLPFSSVIGSAVVVSMAFVGVVGAESARTGSSIVRCSALPLASVVFTVTL